MDFYEYDADVYPDPQCPLHVGLCEIGGDPDCRYLHWHEAVEFLYCLEGSGTAVSDTLHIPLKQGEMAVINPNRLHTFYSDCFCRYYCLLASPSIWDLPEARSRPFISDPEAGRQLLGIVREMEEQKPFYQTETRARLARLWVYLCRSFPEENGGEGGSAGKQLEMVKAVISYIRRNFSRALTVEELCREVSFSRSYVCHTFKQVTGQSLVEYINYVRCHNARSLLRTGKYNVSECAEQSGFRNLSYFSKLYKRQMGTPPSAHILAEG